MVREKNGWGKREGLGLCLFFSQIWGEKLLYIIRILKVNINQLYNCLKNQDANIPIIIDETDFLAHLSVPLKINIQVKSIVFNERVIIKMLNWKRERKLGCEAKCPNIYIYSSSSGITMKEGTNVLFHRFLLQNYQAPCVAFTICWDMREL